MNNKEIKQYASWSTRTTRDKRVVTAVKLRYGYCFLNGKHQMTCDNKQIAIDALRFAKICCCTRCENLKQKYGN